MSVLIDCPCTKATHRNHAGRHCDALTTDMFDVCAGCYDADKRAVRDSRPARNRWQAGTHVATYWRVYNRQGAGYRWRCSCGHVGTQTYVEDEHGSGHEHARRAFHLHAQYSDVPR